MSRDFSEMLDEYCEENYGHTNWAYLDTCDKEDLKNPHDLEGGIVFYHNPIEDEESEEEIIPPRRAPPKPPIRRVPVMNTPIRKPVGTKITFY